MTTGRIRPLSEADLRPGLSALVRADLDVGIRSGKIIDDSRVDAALPTVKFLLGRGVWVQVIGHLGRPAAKRQPSLTLAPIARYLARKLRRKVAFVRNPIGPTRPLGPIALFENLRFWPGEEKNDLEFARLLARRGDIYVNEAFANCHRPHASMTALAKLLPSYAGLHLASEIEALERILKNPRRPLVAVLGGVKMETKLPLIRRFVRDAEAVLVGGALANTLLALTGKQIGRSVADRGERGSLGVLKSKKLYLPSDVIVTDKSDKSCRMRSVDDIRNDEVIMDIGPRTRARFAELLRGAKTIVWNGPLGFAERRQFAGGTIEVAEAIRGSKAFTAVGGGDTIAVLRRCRLLKGFSHVSTGGGAMLEFLAGEKLPGIEALKR